MSSRPNRPRRHPYPELYRWVIPAATPLSEVLNHTPPPLSRALSERSQTQSSTSGPNHTPTPAMPPTHSPPTDSDSRSQEYEGSRRHKRRRLDSDSAPPALASTRSVGYGRHGQVEPGTLSMKLIFHDAPDSSRNIPTYAPHNMLDDKPSAYCTDSCKYNIILAHQGTTPFYIKELTIKTTADVPFSAPVRGGVVFTSMRCDDMLTRTAKFNIPMVSNDSSSSTQDADDLEMFSVHVDPFPHQRQRSRGASRAHMRRPRFQASILDDDDDDDPDDEFSQQMAHLPDEWHRQENLGKSSFDDTVRVEHVNRANHGRTTAPGSTPPNHIGHLPFEIDDFELSNMNAHSILSRIANGSHERQNLVDGNGYYHHYHPDESPAGWDDAHPAKTMSPVARFEIGESHNRCDIAFEFPIPARFLLLKMWSSHEDYDSIAIHSITVNGFAGPRFVPALDLR